MSGEDHKPTPGFTIVVGVDKKHLEQLAWTWPTWRKHKPSLLKSRMVIFRDHEQVTEQEVRRVVDHPDLIVVEWPQKGVEYLGGDGKWNNAQRYKMLSGFVHLPPIYVKTKYYLKLDTDVVATGVDDWIDPEWFRDYPLIVSQKWGYTKPPNQMWDLDEWSLIHRDVLNFRTNLLNLHPKPGDDRIKHKRFISWCGFFSTEFTKNASYYANMTVGTGQLPVRSQDGYLYYLAKRLGSPILDMGETRPEVIVRCNFKELGWQQWSVMRNVRKYSMLAMES